MFVVNDLGEDLRKLILSIYNNFLSADGRVSEIFLRDLISKSQYLTSFLTSLFLICVSG